MLEVLSKLKNDLKFNKFIQKYFDLIDFFESYINKVNPIAFNFYLFDKNNDDEILRAINKCFNTPLNKTLLKNHSKNVLSYVLDINVKPKESYNINSIRNFACGAMVYITEKIEISEAENFLKELKKIYGYIIIFMSQTCLENFKHHKSGDTILIIIDDDSKFTFNEFIELLSPTSELFHNFCVRTKNRIEENILGLSDFIRNEVSVELKKLKMKSKILNNKKSEFGTFIRSQDEQELKLVLKSTSDELNTTLNRINDRISEKLDVTHGSTFEELKTICTNISLHEDFIITEDKETVYLNYNQNKEKKINNLLASATQETLALVGTFYQDSLDKLENELNNRFQQSKIPVTLNTTLLKQQFNEAKQGISAKPLAFEQKSQYKKGRSKMDYISAFRKWMFLPISIGMLFTYIGKPFEVIFPDKNERWQEIFYHEEINYYPLVIEPMINECKKEKVDLFKKNFNNQRPGPEAQKRINNRCLTESLKKLDKDNKYDIDFVKTYNDYLNDKNSFWARLGKIDKLAILGLIMLLLLPWFYKQGKKEVIEKAQKNKEDTEKRAKEDLKNKLLPESRAIGQELNNKFRTLLNQVKQNFQNELAQVNHRLNDYLSNEKTNKGSRKMEVEIMAKSLKKDLDEYSQINVALNFSNKVNPGKRLKTEHGLGLSDKEKIFKNKEQQRVKREEQRKKTEEFKKKMESFRLQNEEAKKRIAAIRKKRNNPNT